MAKSQIASYCLILLVSGCSGDAPAPSTSAVEKQDERYEGTLDVADEGGVRGWAWDKSHPDAPVTVDIFDGDELLVSVRADIFRKGLLDKGKGNAKHSFKYAVPAKLMDGNAHTIRAKISGTSFELVQSPKTVTLRAQ